MTDINPHDSESRRNLKDDALDRELNAALAKFVAVEPRTGLEQRVLANLRTEQKRAPRTFWQGWPAVATSAALAVVLSISAVWRSARPAHDVAVHRSPATTPTLPKPETQAANRGLSGSIPPRQAKLGRRNSPRLVNRIAMIAASAPKLDRFPSPQPLSEQEKILQTYLSNYPEDAVLVARARAEAQRRDAAEETSDGTATTEEDLQR